MLHANLPSFVEIDQTVPEKKIFEEFYHIYGHGGQTVSEKKIFEIVSG